MSKAKPKKATIKKTPKIFDERTPKILGVILIIFSFYLFGTFISYLFNWEKDWDKVDRMSWNIIFAPEIEIANKFGRLGAIVSHQCFAWFTGIGAFLLIPLLFLLGRNLVLGKPLSTLNKLFQYGVFSMFWIAVFTQFIFDESRFPWGGTIGQFFNDILRQHLGIFGSVLFFIATLTTIYILAFNPSFEDFKDRYKMLSWLVNPFKANKNSKLEKELTQEELAQYLGSESTDDSSTFDEEEFISPAFEPVSTPVIREMEIEHPQDEEESYFSKNIPESDLVKGPEDFVSFNIEFKENQQKAKEELVFQEENLEESTLFDPTKELSRFVFPPTDLLQKPDKSKIEVPKEELLMLGKKIEKTLLDHKIEATVVKATIGPSVTLFELQPAAGVPLAKIQRLGQDLAMSLKAPALSIPIAPIPSKGTIGLEVPNDKRQMVTLRELLESNVFRDTKMDIPLVLGKTISNEVFIADLAKMPHLLIAGATGQGKSVGINTILMSILYKQHPANLKLVLIDPKKVELSIYSPLIKHYLGFLDEEEPIITDTQKVIATLASLCKEMDDRYNLLKDARVRSIKEYNEKFISRVLSPKKGHRFLPYIVLIIDEFADLIMTAGKDVEIPIARLAQLARAIGIHLIIATQRPTTNIITGTIKANFPARIAFTVSSGVDSKTILDSTGAEDLIGKGDMLVGMDGKTVRVQGAFVDTAEVDAVIDFVGNQQGFAQPFYLPEVEEGNGGDGTKVNLSELDPMIRDAAHLIVQNQSGSTSMLQRRFEIGYNRAGRIMDQLEGLKVVGPAKNSKPREVYFDSADELERFLSQFL